MRQAHGFEFGGNFSHIGWARARIDREHALREHRQFGALVHAQRSQFLALLGRVLT
jgi:hypothetical protein